jgi:hypothetical protein
LRAALLFAVGVGAYAKGVIQVSNLTMLLGLALLLVSLDLLWSRKYVGACVFFALAAASHEIVLAAPALVPLLIGLKTARSDADSPESAAPPYRAGRAVGALLGAIVIASLLPGIVGTFCRLEVELSAFMVMPVNVQGMTALADATRGALTNLTAIAVQSRYFVGLAVTLLLAILAFKGRRLVGYCVAWLYVFFVPSVCLMMSWGGDWLERRYLHIPAVGACLLASVLLARVACRRRVFASIVFTLLIAWGLTLSGFVMYRHRQVSRTPVEAARRDAFREEMRALGVPDRQHLQD